MNESFFNEVNQKRRNEQYLKDYIADIDLELSNMSEEQLKIHAEELATEFGMQDDLTHCWNPRERVKYLFLKMAEKEMRG
jgi:hypothetical protein